MTRAKFIIRSQGIKHEFVNEPMTQLGQYDNNTTM